jgi:hypothetical protein
MSVDLNDLAKLSVDEQLQAMEVLWAALTAHGDIELVAPDWHDAVVAERVDAYRRGLEPSRPFEEVMYELQRDLAKG